MKKMRKLLAVLMTLAMVMGLGMTSFAADEATITINNVDKNTVVKAIQIIAPDATKDTGWTFVNGALAAYQAAFKDSEGNSLDEQTIIWMLIGYADTANEITLPTGVVDATPEQISNALAGISNHVEVEDTDSSDTVCQFSVSSAGVYAIDAEDTTNEYAYSVMAAYINFTYNESGESNGIEAGTAATINAKKVDTKVEKTDDTDKVVEIGDKVTYTVTTTVPFIEEKVTNVVYNITDTISGARYDATDNKLVVNVKYGTTETTKTVDVTTNQDGTQTFTVDLSDIAANRNNANATLVLSYSAIVTSTVVSNTVVPNDGKNTFTPAVNMVYTGSLTMTKYAEDGTTTLEGAQFVVYKVENDVNQYALFDVVEGKLVLNGFTTSRDEAIAVADENKVVTGTDGKVTVYGLDDSETYYFDEVVAPEGYSINEEDKAGVWDEESPVTAKVGSTSMIDTKLNALPATGGIGTTIFTIGGCAIMVAAAYMYFVSRRREEEQ